MTLLKLNLTFSWCVLESQALLLGLWPLCGCFALLNLHPQDEVQLWPWIWYYIPWWSRKDSWFSISNQSVYWSDHLLVLQKVSLEVNYLSSWFMSIAAGKIGEFCFILLLGFHKQPFTMQMLATILTDFPTFATEHVHYYTQEATIIN